MPDPRALVERLNHVMALNRLDSPMTVPRDLVRGCRDALALCAVNHSDAVSVSPSENRNNAK